MKNKDNITDTTIADEGKPLPAPVAAPENTSQFKSVGQHAHKWGTYLSVDWIWNATAGAAFAYWGKFTPSGKAMWSKPVDHAFESALKPFIENPENLKRSVGAGNTFMSIIAGGMLTIPPLLVLENTKIKLAITKTIDSIIYGKDRVANDPKFQQAYEEIENAPKKDFWTGMTSRFAALAPLLAVVLIPQTGNWLKKNLFEHVGNASKKAVTKLGLPESRLFKNHAAAEQQTRWNYVHNDAIAMDLSFGLPYAGLHAYFYDKFASKSDEKAHEKEAHEQPQAEKPECKSNGKCWAKGEKRSFREHAQTSGYQMGAAL